MQIAALMAVTVKIDDAADPNDAAAAKLVEALRELSTVLGADLSAAGSTAGLRSFSIEGQERARAFGVANCTAPASPSPIPSPAIWTLQSSRTWSAVSAASVR